MNDEQPKNVAVVLTEGLASRSLAAAHAAGVSRSELVRQLLTAYVDENGTEYE